LNCFCTFFCLWFALGISPAGKKNGLLGFSLDLFGHSKSRIVHRAAPNPGHALRIVYNYSNVCGIIVYGC